MEKSELSFLLTAIYVYERRETAVSQIEVEAWYQILEDVDFEDAKKVVTEHFSESDRRLSPAAIRTGARAIAATRKPPESPAERMKVPNADPDDPKAFIKALKAKDWQPDPIPGEPPQGGLELGSVGRKVPEVTAEEVADNGPRPRRWWVPRRQRDRPEGDGMGQGSESPVPE